MSKVAIFFLALLMLVAGGTALLLGLRQAKHGEAVRSGSQQVRELPAEPLESFELTDQNGKPFHSESLQGDVWIASFFFASCPVAEGGVEVEEEKGVKFVAISVDPAADTPHVLHSYAKGFKAKPNQWFFLTDLSKNIDYIRRVGQDIFKVPVTTQGHADTLVLVGRDGAIVDYFNWKKPERMAELNSEIEKQLALDPTAEPKAPSDSAADPSEADAPTNASDPSEASEPAENEESIAQ